MSSEGFIADLRKHPMLGANTAIAFIVGFTLILGALSMAEPLRWFFAILVFGLVVGSAMFGIYGYKFFFLWLVTGLAGLCFSIGSGWYGALMGASISGLSIVLHTMLANHFERRCTPRVVL